MRQGSLAWVIGLSAVIFLVPRVHGRDWLDVRLPSVTVSGSVLELASELQRLGIRVSVEDVVLGPDRALPTIQVSERGIRLRDLLDQITRANPEIGWKETHFLMCRVIHLFRRSTVTDPRNPLNLVVREFVFKDADLYDIGQLVYSRSEEFRRAVNPKGTVVGYAGSKIGGISSEKKIEIRYSAEMENVTVRELLDGLVCMSVNYGLSWHFSFDSRRQYPDNFVLRRF